MKLISVLFLALMLSSCASHSDYKAAKGSGYGYKDVRVSDNHYRVEYKSANDNEKKVADLALLRAAEITLEQGYDWFVITKRDTSSHHEKSAPAPLLGSREVVTRNCGLLACRTRVEALPDDNFGVADEPGSEVDVVLDITIGRGVRPAKANIPGDETKNSELETYDARETADNLRARLKL